ncbi:energy-coupling factor ABC transporter ATP-binding protein [bacterium]|nr:energy-coupling factor ABC transporter ATP-binding protein [bacterium]
MKGKALFSCEDLTFSYGPGQPRALSIPGLAIEEGQCVALLGPNGSGKTTLLKLFNGLLPEDGRPGACSGALRFRGDAVIGGGEGRLPPPLRRDTIYMHQHPYVLSGGVARNMAFACGARGLSGRAASETAREALRLVGLEGLAGRRRRGLSGGEAQRLALARVIASGAEVLLLDEPTAGVDAASRDRIAETLSMLARKGVTILFSTHEPEILGGIAGRVISFERGAIVGDVGR